MLAVLIHIMHLGPILDLMSWARGLQKIGSFFRCPVGVAVLWSRELIDLVLRYISDTWVDVAAWKKWISR